MGKAASYHAEVSPVKWHSDDELRDSDLGLRPLLSLIALRCTDFGQSCAFSACALHSLMPRSRVHAQPLLSLHSAGGGPKRIISVSWIHNCLQLALSGIEQL
eukprot:2399591-Pleurochrysis_carterae.AAC.1